MLAPSPLWARILATVVAAATLSLLSPPPNWHGLHWVAYLPMFWALRPDTPRENRWLAWLYGTVGVGLLFRWIAETITIFSPAIPSVGAYGVLLIFAGVYGAVYVLLWPMVHPLRARLGRAWVFAFPALMVALEWLSTYFVLFPYHHGVSQYRFPFTWQLASITGVWGVTYLVVLVNAALAEWMYSAAEGKPAPQRQLATVGAVLAGVVLFGAWRYERVEQALRAGDSMTVAQMQSDKGMQYRMSHPRREEFDSWLAQTKAAPPGTDLAVWPEGACPYDLDRESTEGRPNRARDLLADVARDQGLELVVGGGSATRRRIPGTDETEFVVFNSVFHFTKDGEVSAKYDKMVPLPFGEYLPFGDTFPKLRRSLGIGNFAAGEVPVVFEGGKARMASPICYEAILTRVCRRFDDPDVFVTITNDAWFGDTASPHQHAMLAAIRAIELGIPVYRSAYTGVSMVIEPHGAILYETEPFDEVSRVVEVRNTRIHTLYATFGDWFVVACLLGLAGAWWTTREQAPSGAA